MTTSVMAHDWQRFIFHEIQLQSHRFEWKTTLKFYSCDILRRTLVTKLFIVCLESTDVMAGKKKPVKCWSKMCDKKADCLSCFYDEGKKEKKVKEKIKKTDI